MRYIFAIMFVIVGTVVLAIRPNKPRIIQRDGVSWAVAPGCMLYTFPEGR